MDRWRAPTKRPRAGRDEVVRAVLAFAAVPGALVALALLWLLAPLTTGEALARVDGISRWLQAAMTAVIGFYFGQLGTRRAELRAREAEESVARTVSAVPNLASMAERAEDRVTLITDLLERLDEDPAMRGKVEDLMREVEER